MNERAAMADQAPDKVRAGIDDQAPDKVMADMDDRSLKKEESRHG